MKDSLKLTPLFAMNIIQPIIYLRKQSKGTPKLAPIYTPHSLWKKIKATPYKLIARLTTSTIINKWKN